MLNLLRAKIHRIKVTESNLNYIGSIFIDSEILAKSGIITNEKVDIYNITNGQRFSTYAVAVDKRGYCSVNGAAARLVQQGDLLIVAAFAFFDEKEAKTHKPNVVLIDFFINFSLNSLQSNPKV